MGAKELIKGGGSGVGGENKLKSLVYKAEVNRGEGVNVGAAGADRAGLATVSKSVF